MSSFWDCKLAIASSLLVMVIYCSKLPLSVAAESQPLPCKPKSILVDVKDNTNTYDIPYDVCVYNGNPACYFSEGNDLCDKPIGPPGVGKITEAQLYISDSEKIQPLINDDKSFNVTIRGESFTKTGIFNWIASYKYMTDSIDGDFIRSCTCQVNLTLTITVDDLELHLDSDTATILSLNRDETMFQINEVTNKDGVILRCSSGLQDRLTPLRFKFVFSTTLQARLSINEDYNKTVWCNETDTGTVGQYGNWLVNHQDGACILQLVDFSQTDNGTYGCIMYLPDGNSLYNDDLSNTIQLIAPSDMTPASVLVNVVFVVAITIGALFVSFIVLTVSGYAFYSYRKRSPAQNPATDRLQGNGYGTFSQYRSSESDLRPSTPNVHILESQETQASTQEEEKKHQETVLASDTQVAQQSADPVSQEQKSSSDIDSHQANDKIIYSDDELTAIAIAGEQETPPCNHRGTCNRNLICQRCNKTYCTHQWDYYTRHVKSCKGTSTGSESGSNSNTPSIEGSGEQS